MKDFMHISNLDSKYRDEVTRHIFAEWGEPIVSKGEIVDIRDLPGFAAEAEGRLAGALLYRIRSDACEIVVLFSLVQSRGVGAALIAAAIDAARANGCGRIWLITTNDNTPAMRFYQRQGFNLAAAHINAFDRTRMLKKEPLGEAVLGVDDIPIRHEMEFEILL